ncbi:hypothetical protein [Streptomyces abikoensis]|uniref:hypothetical protein n=1 Tax=Streptomyces abikoensis TaxID=97398 RepID=UPI003405553F
MLGLVTVLEQIVWMHLAQAEVAWAQVAVFVGVTAALGTVLALGRGVHGPASGGGFRGIARGLDPAIHRAPSKEAEPT